MNICEHVTNALCRFCISTYIQCHLVECTTDTWWPLHIFYKSNQSCRI